MRGHNVPEVTHMKNPKKYHNLGEMLTSSSEIFSYYTSLPAYVRSMIGERSDNIHTEEELHGYADKLLRGDD